MGSCLKRIVAGLIALGSALFLMGSSPGCGGPPQFPDPPGRPEIVWSHDGQHIVFSPTYLGIFVVDIAGTRFWSIPENTELGSGSYPGNFSPALSPNGSKLAYVTFWEYGNAEIMTANFDGTDVRRLTNDEALDTNPSWSPDGRQIAFTTGHYRAANLAVMDADGSNVRLLAPSIKLEGHPDGQPPVWSPDGNWIAFVGQEGSYEEGYRQVLYTVRPDGSDLTELGELALWWWSKHETNRKILRGSPTSLPFNKATVWWWSPDGKWITFVGADELGEQDKVRRDLLYTVHPNGSGFNRLAEIHRLPVWSPDSSRLAFIAAEVDADGEEQYALYTVEANGLGLTRLATMGYTPQWYDNATGPLWESYPKPAWSPDGTWLAFAKDTGPVSGIYMARADGTEIRTVIVGHGSPVSWSADGSELFIGGMQHAVRTDGTALRKLIPGGVSNITSWSPSGSYLAVLQDPQLGGYGSEAKVQGFLYVAEPDEPEMGKRALVWGILDRLVTEAEHSEWRNVAENIAACGDGYVVPQPERNPGLVRDCQSLLLSRDRLAGELYLNWGSATRITNWAAIDIGGDPPRVVRLDIRTDGGIIPPEIGDVSGLEEIRFWGFQGTIPRELGKLSNLRVLDFYFNSLVGSIPPELGNLTSLEKLTFEWTGLYGYIPPELGNLTRLEVLLIEHTGINSSIPSELGNLTNLQELDLRTEGLFGKLPPELGRLANLKKLTVAGTRVSGRIPSELGNLTNLVSLSLDRNNLSGHIPPELGNLTRLTALTASNNDLSGHIPSEIGNLSALRDLSLRENSLSGTIPPELGDLRNLRILYLDSNDLSGTFPPELGRLASLEWLRVGGNDLGGCVPESLSSRLNRIDEIGLAICK